MIGSFTLEPLSDKGQIHRGVIRPSVLIANLSLMGGKTPLATCSCRKIKDKITNVHPQTFLFNVSEKQRDGHTQG